MYFEFLVEDSSGKAMLEILIPKIAPELIVNENYKIHPHKGISHLMKKLQGRLSSFGSQYSDDRRAYIFVISDLDEKCLIKLKAEFKAFLDKCNPKPQACFCIAIEEMEAWLLGDITAIKKAYPKAREKIIKNYKYDSICGTWELLANATCLKGSASFANYIEAGTQKHEWAEKICPYMDINSNKSPSFQYFRDKLLNAINAPHAAS